MNNVWVFQLIFGVLQGFFILALAWLIALIKGIEKDHSKRLDSHHERLAALERSTDVDVANLRHYKNMLNEIASDVKAINNHLTDPKFFDRCPNRLSKGAQ